MIYELNYPASKLLEVALNHIFVLDDMITWCFFFLSCSALKMHSQPPCLTERCDANHRSELWSPWTLSEQSTCRKWTFTQGNLNQQRNKNKWGLLFSVFLVFSFSNFWGSAARRLGREYVVLKAPECHKTSDEPKLLKVSHKQQNKILNRLHNQFILKMHLSIKRKKWNNCGSSSDVKLLHLYNVILGKCTALLHCLLWHKYLLLSPFHMLQMFFFLFLSNKTRVSLICSLILSRYSRHADADGARTYSPERSINFKWLPYISLIALVSSHISIWGPAGGLVRCAIIKVQSYIGVK